MTYAEEIELVDECWEKLQLKLIYLETALASEGMWTLTIGQSLEEPYVGSRTPPPPPLELITMHSETGTAQGPKVKLPKLILKKFNGELTTGTTFWDSFESTVHNNPNLTSIDKFNYLHSLLEWSAAEAVSWLTLEAANYEEEILILKKRFGNKQQIINKHMDTLLNLEVVSSYNLKGLWHLFDKVETHVIG